MTLAENVALPLSQYTELDDAQVAQMVDLKLALVGLSGFGGYYPSEISGGMKKPRRPGPRDGPRSGGAVPR